MSMCVNWTRTQTCSSISLQTGSQVNAEVRLLSCQLVAKLLPPRAADMVDDMMGCNIVGDQLARGSNATQAAAALVSAAYQKGSCDNISVLVVRIRRRQPGDATSIA